MTDVQTAAWSKRVAELERELAEARAEIERLNGIVQTEIERGLREQRRREKAEDEIELLRASVKAGDAEIKRVTRHLRDCQKALDEATRSLRGGENYPGVGE